MIYYSTPYSLEKCLGKAHNQFIRLLPNDEDFACLLDGDVMFTVSNFGHNLQAIIDANPDCRLFYARTNRIACPWQLDSTVQGDDIRKHRVHGRLLSERLGTAVREVQYESTPGSGFLILVRKDMSRQVPFIEQGVLDVDWGFFRR